MTEQIVHMHDIENIKNTRTTVEMDGNLLTLEVNVILISEKNTVLLTKLIPLENTYMYHISRHLENEMQVTTWKQ